jgi:hypothetical protein
VIQGKRSIIWKVRVLVIVRKKFHTSKCLILIRLNLAFESITLLFVGLDLKENLRKKVGYMRRIIRVCLNASASRRRCDLRTRVAKCLEADGQICEELL